MANPTDTKSPDKPTPRFLWIVNNEERVRIFPLPPVYHKQSKTTVADAAPLMLAPGANLVERKRWQALKDADTAAETRAKAEGIEPTQGEIARCLAEKIPHAAHRNRSPEKAGSPYLVEGPGVANERAPLADLTEAQALEVVGEIRSEEMLDRCMRVERRPDVAHALKRQHDLVTKGAVQAA